MLIISAPHFYAAVVLNRLGIVKRTAPILSFMQLWPASRVMEYCARKNWRVVEMK